MPIATLTTGVIGRIMLGEDVEKPVLQILGVKKISGGETDRFRLLISDGKYLNSYAMLATQLNHLYAQKDLTEHTIIRVDKYITSVVNKTEAGKRVLIILELTVLNSGSEVGCKIGDPVSYTEGAAQASSSASAAPVKTSTSQAKPNTTQGKTAMAAKQRSSNQYNNNNNSNNDITMNQSINAAYVNPICSLSPYQNKWVIKVRVMSKSAMRSWSNAKGEGKLFSMDLMDESGEIRATAFNDQAAKFYDIIDVDRVYYITKCQLKPANKQYSKLNNDYEMTFNAETVVQVCDEDEGIPQIKYNLVPISAVVQAEPKSVIDTIGICKEIGDVQQFTAKTTNKEFKKRDLTLVDSSNTSVQLTLWGDEAENFAGHVNAVILAKGASVNEFNGGKSLSMGAGATLKINPDIPEGHQLRGWFDNNGGTQNITNISARTGNSDISTSWMSFHEARSKKLGTGDKPDYFQIKAIIHTIKLPNAYYKACPQADCNKKVIDENDGHYRCERCNAVFPEFKYRLLINMNIGDWTSNRWVTVFNEVGEQILKRTAKDIGELLESNPTEAGEFLKTLNFQSFVFKLRSKMEIYGDQNRNKLTVQSASPVNHKDYQKYLINSLKELTGIGKE